MMCSAKENLIISGLIPRGSAPKRWVQGSTLGFDTFYSKRATLTRVALLQTYLVCPQVSDRVG